MEKNMIWNEKYEDIMKGYKETEEKYICVLCGKEYQKGRIYLIEDILYDGYGMIKKHIGDNHGSTTDFLLQQNGDLTGISDIQQQILKMIAAGEEDKRIADKLGIAYSTVRNHRFKLREKQKQAKLFLILMDSLEQKINHSNHQPVYEKIVDERDKVLKAYMDKQGKIIQFPPKEKKKLILLKEILKHFSLDTEYTEKEVNQIIQPIYEDTALIRRLLIEYGFLERAKDGSVYQIRNNKKIE